MKKLTLPVYNLKGETVSTVTLNSDVFAVSASTDLIHQAVVTQTNNARHPIAQVKDRGEVAGTNKKPWRQKGTGSARVGSARSPLWRGGGVTFGPSHARTFSRRLPAKMKHGAWRGILSDSVRSERLFIIEKLELDGKTKSWTTALKTLSTAIPALSGKSIIVDGSKTETADRSIRNLPLHHYVSIDQLTLLDLFRYPTIVMTTNALETVTERLAPKTKVKS